MKKISVLAALFILACGLQAVGQNAANVVYQDPAGQGTQNFTGNLALTFTVNSPETVTDLGVFNYLGNGIVTSTVDVGLKNLTTGQVVATDIFTPGNYPLEGLGYDVYKNITPVALTQGDSYELDEVGLTENGNLNTGSSSGPVLNNLGGELTFLGAAWDSNNALDYPITCSTCQLVQTRQFDAATLSVPEGGASLLYLLLAGGACFGAMFLVPRNRFANLASA